MIGQDYPPFGSEVPTAHFDHGKRPQLTPPAPNLLADGRTAESAWNTRLVGYDTLDGRSTYQPFVIRQGKRYIAYMAHHAGTAVNRLNGKVETNGTSLLDVTDPAHPVYLFHIPGPAGSIDAAGNQMVHVCSGSQLPHGTPGKYYMLRSNGNSSGAANPGQESHQVFDVTNPSSPFLLTTVVDQLSNTHKSWWECDTGIAYLVANDTTKVAPGTRLNDFSPGWHQTGSNQHLKIYDLSNPASPTYIRDYGIVGQQPSAGAGSTPCTPPACEGPTSPYPSGIHGPISAGKEKNRVYMAYGVGGSGVVEIVNRNKLLNGCKGNASCATNPSQADLLAPQTSFFTLPGLALQGGHTSFPIFGEEDGKPRTIVLVVSEEGGNECTSGSAPHAAWLYDVTHEADAKQISRNPNDPALTLLDVPDRFDGVTWDTVSNGLAGDAFSGVYPDSLTPQDPKPLNVNTFCNQGGRFGAHSSTELFYPPYYGRLAILSWFAGGLRVFDIRNPDNARPIAYFIPAPNDHGCGPLGGPDTSGPGCTFVNNGRDGHPVHAIQTNNVEVDDRGYIYLADRAGTGMHIVALTGQAKAAALGDDEDDRDDRGDHDGHGGHGDH